MQGELKMNQPLTMKDAEEYLTSQVFYWRGKKAAASNHEEELIASVYIDAYQSSLKKLFEKTVPPPKN